MKTAFAPLVSVVLGLAPLVASADWLHYRGPLQNGVVPGASVPDALATSPKELWRIQVGLGTASVTVQGKRAYTMGSTGEKDVIYCLDTATGKEVWRKEYPMSVDPNLFEGGPRATPVLDGGLVYCTSHEGDLFALDAATGKDVWYKHFQRDFKGRKPTWGYSSSPLVHGNMLICDVGGPKASTVAFDKKTGKTIWATGTEQGGYASPVIAKLGGQETLLMFKTTGLVGCDPATGKELWSYPWTTSYDVHAATPIVIGGDKVFITTGYNTGCALVQVRGGKVERVWQNKNLRSQINSPVLVGNTLYGIDGNTGGNLTAISVETGERLWQERSVKGAALIAAGERLVVLTEKGELVIAAASPSGFQALSRGQIMPGRNWAQPALDGGQLYLRNNQGELVCLLAK